MTKLSDRLHQAANEPPDPPFPWGRLLIACGVFLLLMVCIIAVFVYVIPK